MKRRSGFALFLASALFMPAAGHAQAFGPLLGTEIPFNTDLGRNVGVTDRKRPEVEALGIRTGGFIILPQIETGAGYTNNVYGALTGKTSDAFFTIEPQVIAQSQWSRHELDFTARGAFKRFGSQTAKNEDGAYINANGRIDIGEANMIEGIASYQRAYEAQYSGSFPSNAAGSVPYSRLTGLVRGTFVSNRVRLIGDLDINKFTFDDTPALSGAVIGQKFRDRTDSRASGRVEYLLSPDAAAFVEGTYLDSNYDHKELLGANRSSNEVRLLGGFTFDLTALIRANVGVGIVRRNYDSPVYNNIHGVAADIQLSYFFDELTTFTLGARRDVQDAIVSNSPGYISSRVLLRADHELLRNLLPYVQGEYEHDQFQDITRRDNLYRFRAGANYLANRHWQLEPEVSYIKRDSSGTPLGQAFKEVQFTLRLTAKL
jgi:hypothetical protein